MKRERDGFMRLRGSPCGAMIPTIQRYQLKMDAHRDRYRALYESFRWSVPREFNIAEVCCRRWAQERSRVAIYFDDEAGHSAAYTYAALQAMPTACRMRCWRSASGAATASRSCCRSASRPRSRISRSTSSARSRCRCRCCSAPRRSNTGCRTAARWWRSSTRAASSVVLAAARHVPAAATRDRRRCAGATASTGASCSGAPRIVSH